MNDEPLKPEDITPETFPKATKIPVLTGLPEYLKDPKNYAKIQRELLDTLASTHSHSDMFEWSNCFPCQQRMHNHAEMIRKLGFTCPQQYMEWKKVHEIIDKRVPLR